MLTEEDDVEIHALARRGWSVSAIASLIAFQPVVAAVVIAVQMLERTPGRAFQAPVIQSMTVVTAVVIAVVIAVHPVVTPVVIAVQSVVKKVPSVPQVVLTVFQANVAAVLIAVHAIEAAALSRLQAPVMIVSSPGM